MYSKFKLGFLALLACSCGWLESEKTHELQLNHGYKIFYDINNIAFNYMSIATEGGTPLIDDCYEFFIAEDYLYAKTYKDKTDSEYYKIDNVNREKILITGKEYSGHLANCKACKTINYKILIQDK